VKDTSIAFKTRKNVIRALKLRPDMKAAIRLIELIDEMAETDKQISTEAGKALSELGIAVGETSEARKQNIEQIKREGENEFLRTQLIRQEAQVDRAEAELDVWQKRYLSELDKRYKQINEDKDKGVFLVEFLQDKEAVVRLWALDKTYRWRLVSQLPEELGPILIGLIKDKNRDVRLSTAELLALMQRLNSAEPLLKQHQVERDDQVKTKLFVALGAACSSAITGPPAEIPVTIKKIRSTTLELAADQYLFSTDDEKARYAAEVIRKLLVRDGLKSGDVDKYLNLLSTRYQGEKDKPNGDLRGVLLSAMASLCAPESTCEKKAQSLFESQFKDALKDKKDLVREAAVNGLIYIDPERALALLRTSFYDDPSEVLRKKLIALANQVGDVNDLNYLAEKIGKNSEGELAWQAMLNIFNKETDAVVWKEWVGKLASGNGSYSDSQRIAFFKIAEVKAPAEDKLQVRKKLGDLYYTTDQFEQATDYFGMLYDAAQNPKEKDAILPNLLNASLKSLKLERVTGLISNHLSKKDLDSNSAIIQSLNGYFGKPPLGASQKEVLKVLEGIKLPQERPNWSKWLDGWKETPSKNEEEKADKPKPTKK
jgi:HEAT repeat protein